jgi:hypothetical protein
MVVMLWRIAHEKSFGEARGIPLDKIVQTSWVVGGEV